ncbi:MAG: type 4a pilus biogenesis protein PilO [Gammaproteobacteria bacterium]|nr:type 4a pilus biogenesis protein PilO [Gammaproteobacteria bacterium]
MASKNKLNINDLSTWPIALTLVFCAAIIALFIYMMDSFLVSPVSEEIAGKDKQIVKEEEQYARDKKIVALLPYIEKEVEKLKEAKEKAKEFLPTNVSMPSLIDNVYLAARNNGIVFTQVSPDRDIEEKYYTIKPLSLSANVGYLSMASFIEEVTTLKRIMNVDSVSFVAEGDAGGYVNSNTPLVMTAQLRTYIFNDNPVEVE